MQGIEKSSISRKMSKNESLGGNTGNSESHLMNATAFNFLQADTSMQQP